MKSNNRRRFRTHSFQRDAELYQRSLLQDRVISQASLAAGGSSTLESTAHHSHHHHSHHHSHHRHHHYHHHRNHRRLTHRSNSSITTSVPSCSSLDTLPLPALDALFDSLLDDPETLCSLALCCRSLNQRATFMLTWRLPPPAASRARRLLNRVLLARRAAPAIQLSRLFARTTSALTHLHIDKARNSTLRALTPAAIQQLRFIGLDDSPDLTLVAPLAEFTGECSLARCWSLVDVSPLSNCSWLDLSYCENVWDVSTLGRVSTLLLPGTAVWEAPPPSDFQRGSHCKRLVLDDTEIDDVSNLTHVTDLSLAQCIFVEDVSPLAAPGSRVERLCLALSEAVTDVASLGSGSILSLDLSHCYGVTSCRGLGTIRELTLHACHGLRAVGCLAGVRVLDLSDNPQLTDESGIQCLKSIEELDLSNCTGLVDAFAELGAVRALTLAGTRVRDQHLPRLAKVRVLDLSECQGISDLSSLSGVSELTVLGCPSLHAPSLSKLQLRYLDARHTSLRDPPNQIGRVLITTHS